MYEKWSFENNIMWHRHVQFLLQASKLWRNNGFYKPFRRSLVLENESAELQWLTESSKKFDLFNGY